MTNPNQTVSEKKQWALFFLGIAFLIYLFSQPVFNKKTTYMRKNAGSYGCDLIIDSRGVTLMTFSSSTFVSVDKPSIFNDLIHFDIRWPLFHRLDSWEEESFEFRFLTKENGIISAPLEMFGTRDGLLSSNLTQEKFKAIRKLMITSFEFRLIGKRETSTGFTTDTLAKWDFYGEGAEDFIKSMTTCNS